MVQTGGDNAPTIPPIRTYSEDWLRRHRETHAKHPLFGTHLHPYLRDTIGEVAAAALGAERPSLLDYGCGKGAFLREMAGTGLFRHVRGYDPAVAVFATRPVHAYDIVLCLDVLDQLEDEFVEPAIQDVAQFTARYTVFDVITRQTPALAHLNPRSARTWRQLVSRHMRVTAMTVRAATPDELSQGSCPERVIITAAPRG